MEFGWRDASDHVGDGVAAKGILEESRESRITIGDVGPGMARGKLRDNLSKTRQTGVDGNALLCALALRSCILQALASGEVDKVKLAVDGNPLICFTAHCLEWN